MANAAQIKGVLSLKMLVFFAVYFLLGYILYSTLCAAVGSMVNSEQEAQQLQFLVMMPMILSIVMIMQIFQHPNSQLAFWGSLFPFTAPLVMFTRIAMQTGSLWDIGWQIALSIASDGGNHLRNDLALRTNIPCGHPDVWQETEPAGNHEMDQIRIVCSAATWMRQTRVFDLRS